jgi:hypothetical protein
MAIEPGPRRLIFPGPAWNRLDLAAFELVIAIVERLTNLEYFGKITDHSVLNELIRCPSSECREILKLLFSLGCEAYFHGVPSYRKTAFRTSATAAGTPASCKSVVAVLRRL